MNTTGTTYGTGSILDMAAEQAELAALLADAPAVTPQARELMDRARDEAVRATRRAAGCEIAEDRAALYARLRREAEAAGFRVMKPGEAVADGIGADLEPGEMCGIDECDCADFTGE